MKLFLFTLAIIGIAVFGMCFNIIFRKNGEFPEYEVGSNKEMRRLGIRCMKEEQASIPLTSGKAPSCTGTPGSDCEGCALYNKH